MTALTEGLPRRVYSASQVRELDSAAIARCAVTGYELMCRAGSAALRVLLRRWPRARSLAIVCGAGNNAGDGLVVARLAHADGLAVRVLLVVGAERLRGAAAEAAVAAHAAGLVFEPFAAARLAGADVIVDALLGTGLARPVADEFRAAIEAIDAARLPVLALDIPSGLDADTGLPKPVAVHATATVTFVGLKQGLFLGAAVDHCGELEFAGLDLPAELGAELAAPLERLVLDDLKSALPRRDRSAHKGSCGRLLLVGGGAGLAGAIRLAAEAALRVGAGLVYVATHRDNVGTVLAGRPEIIARGVDSAADLDDWLRSVDGAVLGPGLGQSVWARRVWRRVLESELPLVVDADGLNLLAAESIERGNWLLTPHPAEAARLLGTGVADVQRGRAAAVRELARRYRAHAVLKGAHTLVAEPGGVAPLRVCDRGNPGMATGGTGDVLAGALGGLLVQIGALAVTARAGVLLHALAGDAAAAAGGERGLIASDLLAQLRACANPS
jgi:NAD(P)H-hydrate epimerase